MTVADGSFRIHDILRMVASILEIPVVVFLIFCSIVAVFLAGWAIAEYFTERRHMKINTPKLIEELRNNGMDAVKCIEQSTLLKRQKYIILEIMAHPDFTDTVRQALAVRLIEEEQAHYDSILRISELTAKLGPMFGLLGTLIPLGPGIVALGQGDTNTLSLSLLTAFDTTIAGLACAAVATVVSTYRKSWYGSYMSMLETIAECVLDMNKKELP